MNNLKKSYKGSRSFAKKALAVFVVFLMVLSCMNIPAYATYFADAEAAENIDQEPAENITNDSSEEASSDARNEETGGEQDMVAASDESDNAAETVNATTFNLNATLGNVEAAAFVYNDSSQAADVDAIELVPLKAGANSFAGYTTDDLPGYALIFVKPTNNYLFTNLVGSGANDLYPVAGTQLSDFGNIRNYPNLLNVVAKARSLGYTAVLGFSRSKGTTSDVNATMNAQGQQPTVSVAATVDKTSGVKPGDTLTFTVAVTPGTLTGIDADRVSITSVEPKSIAVNGVEVAAENITKLDGAYQWAVTYTVTENDCMDGNDKVALTASVATTYEYVLGLSSASVKTESTITTMAATACLIAAKNHVNYLYSYVNVEGIDAAAVLPEQIEDTNDYYAGDQIKVAAAHTDTIVDTVNNGYWTFDGWYNGGVNVAGATVTATGETMVFTGTWTFHRASQSVSIANWTYDGTSADAKAKSVITTGWGGLLDNAKVTYSYKDASGSAIEAPANAGVYTLVATWDLGSGKTVSAETTFKIYKASVMVTVTGASDTVTYNGEEQSVSGYTYEVGSELAKGQVAVSYTGKEAVAKGTNADTYKMGLVESSFSATSDNFEVSFTVNDGWIRIEKANVSVDIVGASKTVVYDGSLQQADGFTVVYPDGFDQSQVSVALADGAAAHAQGTNVDEYEMGLTAEKFVTSSTNYNVAINSVTDGVLKIVPQEITIEVAGTSATLPYTGGEQTLRGYTVVTDLPNDLSVSLKSGVDAKAAGTDVGEYKMGLSADSFVASDTDNYDVEFKVTDGVLTVDPIAASVAIAGNIREVVYDGTEHTVEGWYVSTPVAGVDVTSTAAAKASGVDARTYPMGLGLGDFTVSSKNYTASISDVTDGALVIRQQSIDPESSDYRGVEVGQLEDVAYDGTDRAQYPAVTSGGNSLVLGVDYEVAFSSDTVNVGTVTVTVTGKGNYTDSVVRTYEITPLAVTMVSGDASDMYDGAALTNDAVVDDGFVAGEGAVYTVTGAQTDVGSSDNEFTYVLETGTFAKNYRIATTFGVLEVAPREVVLTSATAEKAYDGEELTYDQVDVTGDGFVAGEGAVYTVTGAQTEVGTSQNEFTYELADETLAHNYLIQTVFGTLTVTPAVENDVVVSNPEDGIGSEDGTGSGSTGGSSNAGSATIVPATTDGSNGGSGAGGAGATGAEGIGSSVGVSGSEETGATAGEADAVASESGEAAVMTAAAADGHASELECWTHYGMVAGMLLTAIYGLVVTVRRNRLADSLESLDDELIGEADPVAAN